MGGGFGNAGGDTNKIAIAKWDGTTWQRMGTGIDNSRVNDIFALDNSNVFVGDNFSNVGGDTNKKRIVKWDGSTWSSIGSGLPAPVNAVGYTNSNLYVGGGFSNADSNINKSKIVRTPINYVP